MQPRTAAADRPFMHAPLSPRDPTLRRRLPAALRGMPVSEAAGFHAAPSMEDGTLGVARSLDPRAPKGVLGRGSA